MRSLAIATCLTALLGATQGFADEPAAKPRTAVSHETATPAAAKPADAAPAADKAKTAEAAKTEGANSPVAKTPATQPAEAVVGSSKPADVKPTESKPAEAKALEAKAPEAKPAASQAATDGKPANAKAADASKADATKAPAVKPEDNKGGTVVEIKTTEGTIKLELADREAPVTVKNFLSYVNDKFYDGTIFHRVIDNFVIQGGGYVTTGDKFVEKPTKAAIVNEAQNGLKNLRGTIAMARMNDPNSATAQFYINQIHNEMLDYPKPDGHGYAVFGKVIDGIDVVDKIAKVKTGYKVSMKMDNVPLEDVKIVSIQVVRAAGH